MGSLAACAGLLLHVLGLWSVLGAVGAEPAIIAALFVAGCLVPTRFGAAIGLLDASLATICGIIAFVPGVGAGMASWVRADSLTAGPLDAVVVLSSGVESDTALDPAGTSRLLTGLELARTHPAARLITTTAVTRTRGRRLTTLKDQQRLVGLAGLGAAWTALDSVGDTHDEATRAATLLLASHTRPVRIALVTSPMHTRRACAVFEKAGFQVACDPAVERDWNTWHPASAQDRLAAWRAYVYERLGWLKYRWKGWV